MAGRGNADRRSRRAGRSWRMECRHFAGRFWLYFRRGAAAARLGETCPDDLAPWGEIEGLTVGYRHAGLSECRDGLDFSVLVGQQKENPII